MATHKITKGKTPNGGAYSEIFYFDDRNNLVDESKAVKCAIREYTKDGKMINEIWGICEQ